MDSLGVCIGGMGAMFRPSKVRDTGVEFLVVGMRLEVYADSALQRKAMKERLALGHLERPKVGYFMLGQSYVGS